MKWLIALLALPFAGQAVAQSPAHDAAIRKIVQNEIDTWNKGDAVGYSKDFARDGTFTNIRGQFFTGYDGFLKQHQVIFDGIFRNTTLRQRVISLKFVRPDVAIVETVTAVSGIAQPPNGVTLDDKSHLHTRLLQVVAQSQPAPSSPDSTVIITLGTGTPRPLPDVMGPSTAIIVGRRVFLFDAGTNVERRLAAAKLSVNGVDALFLTHLHSDHVLGVPDLVFTSWTMGRDKPFPVFGPAGTRAMIEHLYQAFAVDIREREKDYGKAGGYQVSARDIAPGIVYDSAGVRVTAFLVEHGEQQAFGYRIDTPTRSIVISGDTRPSETLVRMATGVDVLIHEVIPSGQITLGNRPGVDWAKYIAEHHTTSLQLGELAARAKPKLLIVSHNTRRESSEQLLANIRRAFSGRVVIAEDLQRF